LSLPSGRPNQQKGKEDQKPRNPRSRSKKQRIFL
jgi:hypothetical protein